jgi:hypothetical protein
MTMRSEDLIQMTDFELIKLADELLGIVIPPGTKRTTILTRIVNAAMGARDGL